MTGCNLSFNDETSDLRREVTSLERAADAQQNQIEAANQETASMNSRFLHLQAEHRKLKTQWQVEKTELENRVFQSLSLQQSTLGTLRKKEKDFDSLQSQLFTKLSREVPKGAKGAAIVVSKPLPREWSTGGKVRQNPTLRDAEIQALQSRLSLAEVCMQFLDCCSNVYECPLNVF